MSRLRNCPKCGHGQAAESNACSKCGLIFSKYRPATVGRARSEGFTTGSLDQPLPTFHEEDFKLSSLYRWLSWGAFAMAVLFVGLGIYLDVSYQEELVSLQDMAGSTNMYQIFAHFDYLFSVVYATGRNYAIGLFCFFLGLYFVQMDSMERINENLKRLKG